MMKSLPPSIPVVMTVAGSDSGGGAGIQADLRTFHAFGVFGTCAITALTSQNPTAVTRIDPVPAAGVAAQINTVLDVLDVRAVKTGMLFSRELVEAVCDVLAARFHGIIVTDPVMVSTSGARLLRDDAANAVKSRLLPLAAWITPNIPEAEDILGTTITDRADAIRAAKQLSERYRTGVVLKGGHAEHDADACDIVIGPTDAFLLSCPRLDLPPHAAHGTGCTFSSALTAALSLGLGEREALIRAKAFVLGSLEQARTISHASHAVAGMYPPSDSSAYEDRIVVKGL